MTSLRRAAVWMVAVGFALAGCGAEGDPEATTSGAGGAASSASGTGSEPSSAAVTSGGNTCPSVGDSCTECEAMACQDIYCDCYNSPECVAMAECTAKCDPNDIACNQPCWTAHPTAIAMGALLVDCAATVCAKGCPGYQPLGDCLVCLYDKCPAEMNGCIANPACTDLLGCLSACTTPSCETSCYQAHQGGTADAGPVANCLQASCAAACAP